MAKRYGGGVVHQDSTAQNENVNMNLDPSLLRYNIKERAVSGLNDIGEVFKLMSPKMVFVRGFINVDYNNEQVFEYPQIELLLRGQAGVNEVLHGIYLVKFTSKTGIISELCRVVTDLPILSAPEYLISDSDIFILVYEYDTIKKITLVNDKTSYFFQEISTIIQNLQNTLKGKKDYLPKFKGIDVSGLNVSRWFDNGNETGVQLTDNSLIVFRTSQQTPSRTDIYNNSDFLGFVTEADGVAFTAKEGGLNIKTSETEADITVLEPTRKTAPNTFNKKNLLLNVLDKVIFGFQAGRNIIFTNLKAWFNTDVELKKKLIDYVGASGERGMHLVTNGDYVVWRWNLQYVQYTHTHPDAYITQGYSSHMVCMVYKKLVGVHLSLNSTLSDTGATLKVRVFGTSSTGGESTIMLCEVFNGRNYQKFFVPDTIGQFTNFRTEVTQTPPNLRGLTVVYEFRDWT